MRATTVIGSLGLLAAGVAGWLWWSGAMAARPPAASETAAGSLRGSEAEAASAPPTAASPATTRTAGAVAAPAAGEADADAAMIAVTGVVVDLSSQQPLPGANVTAVGRPGHTVATDESGRFALPAPVDAAGSAVVAAGTGHLTMRVDIRPGDICADAAELRIALPATELGGGIRGTIVDSTTGEPVPDAVVRLPDDTDWPGPATPQNVALEPVVADRQGRFELRPLPAGRYDVLVEAAGHETWRRNAVRVTPMQTVDLGTIAVEPFGWGAVHGRILSSDGAPIAGVAIEGRTQHDNRAWRTGRSDRDGYYSLQRLRPGSVVLSFDLPNAWQAWRTFELHADEDSQQDVRVPTGSHFVGGAVVVGGRPAVAYDIECVVPAAALSTCGLEAFQRQTVTDSDGRFRVDGLPGGPVELNFSQARPWVLENAEQVAIDRVDHRFVFDSVTATLEVVGTVRTTAGAPIAGAIVAPLDAHDPAERDRTAIDGSYRLTLAASGHTGIVLRVAHPDYVPATHVLTSTVVDEQRTVDFVLAARADLATLTVEARHGEAPIAHANLILYTLGRTGYANGVTDAFGRWQGELMPSKWRVFVRHPDFTTTDAEIELAPHGDERLAIALAPMARHARTIELRTTPDVPLPNELIIAWRRGAWVGEARTDELGRARFDGLPTGEIELSAAPPGHARHEFLIEVQDDSDEPIVFRVQPGLLSIQGQVLDAAGAPVEHAEVHCQSRDRQNGVATYTNADGEGRFTFANLPPGDYTLTAYRGPELARIDTTAGASPILLRAR